MNYENYYDSLVLELERSVKLLENFYNVKSHLKTSQDQYLYEVYLLNAVPLGATVLIEILKLSAYNINLDPLKQKPYIVQLYEYSISYKEQFIEILSTFGENTEDRFLLDLLENYKVSSNGSHLDLDKIIKKV